ncbi:hypothetical protein KP509_22G069700 [Ceratopteris richardii]|uniref:Uncharacterized protein n=1 Tax=Ceratopteris richardii TaxID=49495 RepID=A0A8T2S675_CERRI|nr:hypothetical protein KP509_22G069700 [Ceratopteris richardii]
MEDNQSLIAEQRVVSLSSPSSGVKCGVEDAERKRQNCLCAPTTHAGSFRCRLHRKPPQSPLSLQVAAKRAAAAQKVTQPRMKFALQNKVKQNGNRMMPLSSCSTSSRLGHEVQRLSRLSRTSMSSDQNQCPLSDQEALSNVWKTPGSSDSKKEDNQFAGIAVSSNAKGEELSGELPPSKGTRSTRPLLKLPSI